MKMKIILTNESDKSEDTFLVNLDRIDNPMRAMEYKGDFYILSSIKAGTAFYKHVPHYGLSDHEWYE